MTGIIARVRSFWRGLRRPEQLDAEMDEEMRFHMDMEAERVARERRVDPREARRLAAAAFGGVEKYKEAGRDARGVTGITGVSLDVKLGVRMLAKSPGLTLVGGLGMAVAVAIGIGFYAVTESMLHPRLPLPGGERIVALENWNVEVRNEERRSVHDLAAWRGEMKSVREISAFRAVDRGLLTGNEPVRGVRVAEMTASAFRVVRVPPLLGRYLVDEDEREGAPPVVVIGHDAWRKRFAGDPGVVGRAVQLDTTTYTVVGVMPAGFRFPVRDQYWTPLRADPSRHARGEGPEIFVFGRLAPGATWEAARAELAAIGRRAARAYPATHARLRPQLLPYTYPIDAIQNGDGDGVAMMRLFVSLLLVVVAANVAVLVYA
ncbi:MAG TPA: ABC transporter permease, partial [Longimicrobium sp.]|nr:ABC transporter permease [Longimicrobium sp.]